MLHVSQEVRTKQVQKIILSEEMKQSLAVLQMSCTELSEFLNKELMENPLLEREDPSASEPDSLMAVRWASYVKSCSSSPGRETRDADEDDQYTFEKYSHSDMTYHEVLDLQFRLLVPRLSRRQIRIGLSILDHINEDGYFTADLFDLSEELSVSPEETEEVLREIQQFYPSGTGARNVAECLWLQLQEEEDIPDFYHTLLFGYLEDLAENRTRKIEKETGISPQKQMRFLKRIKELHPRPGSLYASSEKTHYIVPDGCIFFQNDDPVVNLNQVGAPALIINPVYRNMLNEPACSPEAREYITERMARALKLIQNIEAREQTIKSIAAVIAGEQKDYLLGMTDTIRPLTQKEIAAKTGLHESTISRTVRGKYFTTPRGTLELKSLFCVGFSKENASIGPDALKQRIRSLIENEDPKSPLSDQKIAELISAETVAIARRTVAKYRDELGIRPASKRKVHIS